MRFLGLIILIVSLSNQAMAQEFIIIDAEKNPISNVAAFNESNTKSTLSNNDGVINLSRFMIDEVIIFQHPNYQIKKIEKNEIESFVIMDLSITILDIIELSQTKNIDNIKNTAEKKIYISSKDIKELNPTTTADLLEKKGGVSVQKSQLGGGSPNIRGFEANKILLMLDGVRLNNAIYRSGHLQNLITIDENMLDDVEIIFGPSSVLYGSDALGGTINMRTRSLYFQNNPTWGGGASSSYHSAYGGLKSSVFTKFSSKKYSTITSFSVKRFGDLKMGGWRPHGYNQWGLVHHYIDENDNIVCNPNPELQKGTHYNQYDIFNKMIFKILDNLRLTSNIQYSTSSNIPRFDKLNDNDAPCLMGENGICANAEHLKFHSYYYGPQNRLFSSIKLTGFDYYFDKSEIIFGYQNIEESRHKWYLSDYLNSIENPTNYDSPTRQYEKVSAYSLNTNFRKGSVFLGSETIYNDVQSTAANNGENIWGFGDTRYPPEGSSLFSSAYYINILKRLSHKVQIEGGGRYTFSHVKGAYPDSMNRPVANIEGLNLSSKNNIFSGNIKILYYPSNSWKISAVTSRGFHAPNVDDMLKVFKKGDIITLPNIDLNPEYSLSQEFSITKNLSPHFTFYGTGFYTQLTNAIIRCPTLINQAPDGEEPLWQSMILYDDEMVYTFSNQNSPNIIDIYGGTIGFNAIVYGFEINGDFNITKGETRNNAGEPVAHIPPNFGKIEVIKKINKLQARFLLLYSAGKRTEDFDTAGIDNLDETPFLGFSEVSGDEIWAGLPSWYTLNFSIGYELSGSFGFNFGVENIMDAHYKTFSSGISAPGRNFIFSGQYNF